ncbi:MAG: hypothetical protein H7234_00410 [Herminiimonas sp.]|nr:hypothetical protein [Herminiimonas sp.]
MTTQNAAKESPHLINEADVGSGEKTPGQCETDAVVAQIGKPLPHGAVRVAPHLSQATDEEINAGARHGDAPDPMPHAGAC